jgi:hypothetical protein
VTGVRNGECANNRPPSGFKRTFHMASSLAVLVLGFMFIWLVGLRLGAWGCGRDRHRLCFVDLRNHGYLFVLHKHS